MRFLSYNVQYSLGQDGNYDLKRTAATIGTDADIIALQEVTRNFSDVPDRDQPEVLAALLECYYWVYGAPVDIDASVLDRAGRIVNRRTQFGLMLLSRWPILSSRLLYLPAVRVFDKHNQYNGALECIVDSPAGALRVYCVHLNHLHHEDRLAQLQWLLEALPNVPRCGGAVSGAPWHGLTEIPVPEEFVVLGDCNLVPDSPEYALLVGEPDYFCGNRLDARHWVDSWVQAGNQTGDGVTWTDPRTERGRRLDYGFVSAGLADKVVDAWIDDEADASDHQPIGFELQG